MHFFSDIRRFQEDYTNAYRRLFNTRVKSTNIFSPGSEDTRRESLNNTTKTGTSTMWDWLIFESALEHIKSGISGVTRHLRSESISTASSPVSRPSAFSLNATLSEAGSTFFFLMTVGFMAMFTKHQSSRVWSYRSPAQYLRKLSQGRFLQPLIEISATLMLASFSTFFFSDLLHSLYTTLLVAGPQAFWLSPLVNGFLALSSILMSNILVLNIKRGWYPAGTNFGVDKLSPRHTSAIKKLCVNDLRSDKYVTTKLDYNQNEQLYITTFSDAIRIISKLAQNNVLVKCNHELLVSLLKIKKFLKDPTTTNVSEKDVINVSQLMTTYCTKIHEDSALIPMLNMAKNTLFSLAKTQAWSDSNKLCQGNDKASASKPKKLIR
mgnify:CR=1 FL=1